MGRIGEARLRSALGFVAECAEADDLESFRQRVLGLLRFVRGDVIAYNEVDLARRSLELAVEPLNGLADGDVDAFNRHADEHPVIAHHRTTGDLRARTISEFLSRERFHRLGLYAEYLRAVGAEDQVAVGLPSSRPDLRIGVAINRDRRSFSAAEVSLLEALRPHLANAYELVLSRELVRGLLHHLDGGALEPPRGVLLVSSERVVEASASAERLLALHYGMGRRGARLPEEWARWLERHSHERHAAAVFAEGRLRAALLPVTNPGPRLLTVEELPATCSERALTAREGQILALARRGLRDVDIAETLGISKRTVGKHLEHAYRKLGVSSRREAARAYGPSHAIVTTGEQLQNVVVRSTDAP